jgi:hypothetical protein
VTSFNVTKFRPGQQTMTLPSTMRMITPWNSEFRIQNLELDNLMRDFQIPNPECQLEGFTNPPWCEDYRTLIGSIGAGTARPGS